jgi:hypothetical protein
MLHVFADVLGEIVGFVSRSYSYVLPDEWLDASTSYDVEYGSSDQNLRFESLSLLLTESLSDSEVGR